MTLNEIATQCIVKDGFAVATGKADQASSAIDVSGCESVTVLYAGGAYTDTTWDAIITECDTSDGTFTTATEVVGDFKVKTTTSAAITGAVAYIGNKKYIKVGATAGGTKSTGSAIKAMVLLGKKRQCP